MMQLPDTNLLLYAVHADSPSHPRARQALEAMLDGPGMALCWLALVGFVTTRSEERRVGKECRSRWSPYH